MNILQQTQSKLFLPASSVPVVLAMVLGISSPYSLAAEGPSPSEALQIGSSLKLSAKEQLRVLEAQLEVARHRLILAELQRKHLLDTLSRDNPAFAVREAEARLGISEAQAGYLIAETRLEAAKRNLQSKGKEEGKIKSTKFRLPEGKAEGVGFEPSPFPPGLTADQKERVEELLREEIRLTEEATEQLERQKESGRLDYSEWVRAQMDVLALKQQFALLKEERDRARELLKERIHLLEESEGIVERQVDSGRAAPLELIKIQRAILSLKREWVFLE